MNLRLINTLLRNPVRGWEQVRDAKLGVRACYGTHIVPLALVAPLAAFFGTTQVGWHVGEFNRVSLTVPSALLICTATFFAMLMVILVLSKTIHWMAQTYDAHTSLAECVSLAGFSATPLLLVGVTMIYPMPWFIYLIGLPMLGYSVALLYVGTPIMMDVNRERGFLFASAILAIALVSLVGLIAVTVTLWTFGHGPEFLTH